MQPARVVCVEWLGGAGERGAESTHGKTAKRRPQRSGAASTPAERDGFCLEKGRLDCLHAVRPVTAQALQAGSMSAPAGGLHDLRSKKMCSGTQEKNRKQFRIKPAPRAWAANNSKTL